MGRKKMKIEEKIDIRLRVDADLHGEVQAMADDDEMTVAGFIRSLIVAEKKRRKREATE